MTSTTGNTESVEIEGGSRVNDFNPRRYATSPIQIWYDGWRGRDRVIRYVGACVVCGRPTWAADDGENDPRGVLGDHAASPLIAEEYGMVGPDVPACFPCMNDEPSYREGLRTARLGVWELPGEPDDE